MSARGSTLVDTRLAGSEPSLLPATGSVVAAVAAATFTMGPARRVTAPV